MVLFDPINFHTVTELRAECAAIDREIATATYAYDAAVCQEVCTAMCTKLPRELRDMVYEYLVRGYVVVNNCSTGATVSGKKFLFIALTSFDALAGTNMQSHTSLTHLVRQTTSSAAMAFGARSTQARSSQASCCVLGIVHGCLSPLPLHFLYRNNHHFLHIRP
jgi:hypothetical protein